MEPMLAHTDSDRWQLGHLTPRWLGGIDALVLGEHTRARAAAVRPMLNELIHPLGRKQPPVPALMTRLSTPLAARPLPARAWRS